MRPNSCGPKDTRSSRYPGRITRCSTPPNRFWASLGQAYSSHGGVLSAFGREFAKAGRLDGKFHRWLLDAQDFRNVGDYGVDATITLEQAAQVCAWAREFLEKATACLRP